MDCTSIDIEALIPHRDGMRLIAEVLSVDEDRAVTSAITRETWPLFAGGSVDTLVTVELVAQTAALLEGWKRLKSNRGGATGWLVGIKHAEFRRMRVPVNETLVTEVRRSYALEGYAVFAGTVGIGSEVVASMQIQAFRPDEAPEGPTAQIP
jgi:predicted hotdog family 3-hydroxylacyl-ACP dehydratase